MAKKPTRKTVETIKHAVDKRKNIPTAEFQSVLKADEQKPIEKRYQRNADVDPQLVWHGKDEQDWKHFGANSKTMRVRPGCRRFGWRLSEFQFDSLCSVSKARPSGRALLAD